MLDGIEGTLAALGGIERLPGGGLDGHIEEGKQGGQDRLEAAIEAEDLASHLLANLAVGFTIVELEVRLEETDDGQVAGRPAVGHRACFQNEPAVGAVRTSKLVDET